MRYLRLLVKYFRIELAREMAYPFSFITTIIGTFFTNLMGPLFALLLYSNTSGIPGWAFEEFLLMQGIFIFVFGLNHAFVEMMAFKTSFFVQVGLFDNVLVKPYNTLLQTMSTSIDIDGFAQAATGLTVMIIAISRLSSLPILNIFILFIFLIIAALFVFSITIIAASLSFYFVKSFVIIEFFNTIKNFGQYPIFIYGKFGIFIFSFLFPIGLAAFYPAEALLGRLNPLLILILMLIGIIFFSCSVLMWNRAIKHYTSAGG